MGIVNRIVGTLSKVPVLGSYLVGNKQDISNNNEQKRDFNIDTSLNGHSSLPVKSSNNFIPLSISATKEVSSTESIFKEKRAELWEISEDFQSLQTTEHVLNWDMSTVMPPKSKEFRAWQLKSLDKMIYEKLSSSTIFSMIEYFLKEENHNKLSEVEKALFREIHREYNRRKSVPLALSQELTDVTTKAYETWLHARELGDFNMFAPELDKIISIKRQIAEHMGYKDSPYDVFLDEYESGFTTKKLNEIYRELKAKLIPMLKKIDEKLIEFKKDFLYFDINSSIQLELARQVLKDTDYDFSRSRIDLSEYPSSQGIAPNDVRLTVSAKNNIFYLIGCALHEGGHGKYDMGLSANLAKTPLYDAPSLGMHESQSRMYETIIGHGMPFWKFYFPKLKEKFPEQLANISLDDFYKAINCIEPPHIRSDEDDDELTYNLQMMVYCEVEQALIEGNIEARDVPKLWNKLMADYLGVKENSAPGALNHDHWVTGTLGYFPTYILGSLYGAQIYAAAKKANPSLEEQIAKGDFTKLDLWLKENIYKYGKVKSADEVLKLATGEDLNINHFVNYIKEKYSKLYNIEL